MRAYHLVNGQHGLSNLRHRRLKVAQIEDLNDPFELRSITSSDKDIRDAFDRTRATLAKARGMLCFSESWNNPVLWSHYADRHRGLALGFDIDEQTLTPVLYRSRRIAFDPTVWKGGPIPRLPCWGF